MPIARDGAGVVPSAGALASQVKPAFMTPALAASAYGALLAGDAAPGPAGVHVVATFLALYTAHVKDSLVDFYGRDEDEFIRLTRGGCRLAIAGAGVGFAGCLAALWLVGGPVPTLLTLPLWPLGFLHAPWLDRHPVGTSADYAVGVSLVVLGGYAAQAGDLGPVALSVAVTILPAVAAGAILADVVDVEGDRRLDKRTVPVVVGVGRGRGVAGGLLGLAAATVLGLVALGVLPMIAGPAAAVLALVGLAAPWLAPRWGLRVAMAGTAAAAGVVLVALRGVPT